MPTAKQNLFTRDDTFFGVCEAIGRDVGFHPNWLRLAFAAPMMFAPLWALGVYFVLGAIVLATRLLVPEPRVTVAADVAHPAQANDVTDAEPMKLAA